MSQIMTETIVDNDVYLITRTHTKYQMFFKDFHRFRTDFMTDRENAIYDSPCSECGEKIKVFACRCGICPDRPMWVVACLQCYIHGHGRIICDLH